MSFSQFERHLFLGLLVDKAIQQALEALNPAVLAIYVHDNSEYLREYTFQNQRYLGRTLPSPSQISDIELMESHILSLFNRFMSNNTLPQPKLWLLPYMTEIES